MKYVGIPFMSKGRDRNGIDCWGLVRLFYIEKFEIKLEANADISASEVVRIAERMAEQRDERPWIKVDNPRYGDVVSMRRGRHVCHVGVMLNTTDMLHILKQTDSLIQPIYAPAIKGRIVSFHRHEVLA